MDMAQLFSPVWSKFYIFIPVRSEKYTLPIDTIKLLMDFLIIAVTYGSGM